jgi:hypothetical protein
MRKFLRALQFVVVLTAVLIGTVGVRADDMSMSAQKVVQQMIEAHGGLQKWNEATALSYTYIFYMPGAPEQVDPWWVVKSTTEIKTGRAIQDWPMDEATLVFDGKEAWTTNWKRGNPPRFMAYFDYEKLTLPWVTQRMGVKLSAPGRAKLPKDEKEYITVTMTFEPGSRITPKDEYTMFIDPETYLLKAMRYALTYGAMMDRMGVPAGAKGIGPFVHIVDLYHDVDGMKFPAKFHTTNVEGKLLGRHVALDFKLDDGFDEMRMRKPANAVVDTSSPKRKMQAAN